MTATTRLDRAGRPHDQRTRDQTHIMCRSIAQGGRRCPHQAGYITSGRRVCRTRLATALWRARTGRGSDAVVAQAAADWAANDPDPASLAVAMQSPQYADLVLSSVVQETDDPFVLRMVAANPYGTIDPKLRRLAGRRLGGFAGSVTRLANQVVAATPADGAPVEEWRAWHEQIASLPPGGPERVAASLYKAKEMNRTALWVAFAHPAAEFREVFAVTGGRVNDRKPGDRNFDRWRAATRGLIARVEAGVDLPAMTGNERAHLEQIIGAAELFGTKSQALTVTIRDGLAQSDKARNATVARMKAVFVDDAWVDNISDLYEKFDIAALEARYGMPINELWTSEAERRKAENRWLAARLREAHTLTFIGGTRRHIEQALDAAALN